MSSSYLSDNVAHSDCSVHVGEHDFGVLFDQVDNKSNLHIQRGNTIHRQVATGLQIKGFPLLQYNLLYRIKA